MNDSITVFLPHLMKFTQAIHSYLRTNRISTHVYNLYLYLSCTQKKKLFISLKKDILIKVQHTTTLIMASYWQSYWVISGTKLTKEGILLWLVRPDVRFFRALPSAVGARFIPSWIITKSLPIMWDFCPTVGCRVK